MSDAVGLYLNEIGQVSLLNAEEERELSHSDRSRTPRVRTSRCRRSRPRARRAHPGRSRGEGSFHPGEPPPRREHRPSVPPPRRHGSPRSGAGGQPRPRARRRQVRLAARLQVLHLCHVLDPPGDRRALDQKASLVRLPGDRSASLRAALRQVSGDGDELDDENARLHRLSTPVSLDRSIGEDGDSTLGDLVPSDMISPEQAVIAAAEGVMLDELLGTLDTTLGTRSSVDSVSSMGASAAIERWARSSASRPKRLVASSNGRSLVFVTTPLASSPPDPPVRLASWPAPERTPPGRSGGGLHRALSSCLRSASIGSGSLRSTMGTSRTPAAHCAARSSSSSHPPCCRICFAPGRAQRPPFACERTLG